MKKRLLPMLIICLLLSACAVPEMGSKSRIDPVADAAKPTTIPADVIETEPTASAARPTASVPGENAAPQETETPEPTVVSSGAPDAFRPDEIMHSPTGIGAQPVPVTVRESYRKTGDAISTTFADHTLDFSALSFAVTALDVTGSGTAVSISVDFPAVWTNAQIHSLLLYLGFSLSVDGEPASDFRLAAQAPLPALSQIENRVDRAEYRFVSEALTVEKLFGRRTLSITPYVDYRAAMGGGKANGRSGSFDLLAGETCTFDGSEYRYAGVELRHVIDALSVTVPLPETFADLPPDEDPPSPLLLPVTLWEEDWERNAETGKYKDAPSFFYGTFRNETYDFGGLRFELEKAMIWENGFRIVCRLILPDSWSDGQRSAFLSATHGGSNLRTELRVDGVEENFHGFLMVPAGFRFASYDDRSPDVSRVLFCVCEENATHLPKLLAAERIHISLYAVHADYADDGEKKYDLTGGAPVYIDNARKWRSEQKTLLREFDLPLNDFTGIKEVQR